MTEKTISELVNGVSELSQEIGKMEEEITTWLEIRRTEVKKLKGERTKLAKQLQTRLGAMTGDDSIDVPSKGKTSQLRGFRAAVIETARKNSPCDRATLISALRIVFPSIFEVKNEAYARTRISTQISKLISDGTIVIKDGKLFC